MNRKLGPEELVPPDVSLLLLLGLDLLAELFIFFAIFGIHMCSLKTRSGSQYSRMWQSTSITGWPLYMVNPRLRDFARDGQLSIASEPAR